MRWTLWPLLVLSFSIYAQPQGRPTRAQFDAARTECTKLFPFAPGAEPSSSFRECMSARGFNPPPPGFKKALDECSKVFGRPAKGQPPSEGLKACMKSKGFGPPPKP